MRKNYDFSKAIKNPYSKRLTRELETSPTIHDNQDKTGRSAASKKRKTVKSSQRTTRAALSAGKS